MSLGGIAIAIGAMVDAAVVMIENAHKHIERWQHAHPGETLDGRGALAGDRRRRGRGRPGAVLLAADHHAVVHSGVHAGGAGRPAVLAARLHEDLRDGGRRRACGDADPGADGLSHPRPHSGRARESAQSLADRASTGRCSTACCACRRRRSSSRARARCASLLAAAARSAASSCRRSTKAICCTCRRRCPGSRPARRRELLQQTDRLIKTVPEVASVFGKAGRAETATDPAPLEMFETTIQFKPREQWRAGMTPDKLVEELDRIVQGARAWPTSGCRRSAIASTCSPPASRARSASRSRAPNLAEIDRITARDRARGEGRARRDVARSPSG